MVGDGHGWHTELYGSFREVPQTDGAVKKGVHGMEMKMDKAHEVGSSLPANFYFG
jgi:hypothetical protein